ncbi:MAG: hypothetical protein IJ693_11835 [Bacteroidaceae bacterium]|nr:hypothetical protein [Bacteroidaceae bacterium]
MIYNIFDCVAPAMPKPAKGTEICKLLLSQASKDMREPLVPMAIPALAAHLKEVEFMYSDNQYYELCGQMGHLIGASGVGKAQLTRLVEAIQRSFRDHDEGEYKRLTEWIRLTKTKGANKEKPERPEVAFWFPPADLTNPAFIQNAMALEAQGGRTQYLNLPEVEMADKMCGGHRQVSQTVRNIYDRQRAGALRATADGVTGNPILRVNITFSSTPDAARAFYKKDLTNGFFGRIPFAYKARGERKGRIPRQGAYDEEFLAKLDGYILRLDNAKGRFVVKPLNKIADQLAEEMATLADLADDDMLFELSHRSLFSAWKKGATLWLLNNHVWTRSIGEYVVWFCYYDLWSKVKVFGDMFKGGEVQSEDEQKSGPKNMLDNLGNVFNELQLEALRVSLGKSKQGTKHQLNVWKNRGFITYSCQTGLYTKTDEYLKGNGQ